MVCAKHNVETFLRCGKCDKPICPDCMVASPAGTRCRDCASNRSSPLFQVHTERLALGIVVGLAVAVMGGLVLAWASGFGFLLLWGALFYGGIVGEAVLRAVNRKRGFKIEVTAGACALLGPLLGMAAWMQVHNLPLSLLLTHLGNRPFFLLAIGIGVFAAVSRVRYI